MLQPIQLKRLAAPDAGGGDDAADAVVVGDDDAVDVAADGDGDDAADGDGDDAAADGDDVDDDEQQLIQSKHQTPNEINMGKFSR